jgi:hypothetical protein
VVPSETGMERRHVLVSINAVRVIDLEETNASRQNGSKWQAGLECKKLVLN